MAASKTAGIVIDDWKLPIFKKHLDAAGFTYQTQEFTKSSLLVKVSYEWVHTLQPIITAAQTECANFKRQS